MPENTGPNGVNGSNDPDEPHELNEPHKLNEPHELNEPRELNEPHELNEPRVNEPRELNEPIAQDAPGVPAEPSSAARRDNPYEPEEITGPPRPSSEIEPAYERPEELRVVPIEPYYVEPYYAEFPEQDAPPEEPTEPEKAPRPERIKRAAVVGARVVTGTVGVLVAAAVVAAAALIPLPNYSATAPVLEVAPVETGQQLVCPGSVLALSESADTEASATTPLGPVAFVSGSTGSASTTAFTASDAGSGDTGAAPQLLTSEVDPTSDEPLLLSGAQVQGVDSESFTGLAAASCATATAESWLVGGATTTGRSTLITLSNPSTVAADVDLEIFGELGAVTAPGLTGITVAPGAQRVLSLAGFAPQLASPVVHVTSSGGLVVANLQQTTIRGIAPGGIDIVGSSTAPSATNVIPGVSIAGAEAVASRLGAAGFEDLSPTLRIFVPGADTAEAEVRIQAETGAAESSSFVVDVTGGTTMDLPIDDVVDGDYTITVDTDVPVVAGVRVAVVDESDGSTDFAWLSSASMLDGAAMVSTPRDLASALHLANPSSEPISVAVTAIAGSAVAGTAEALRTIDIASGATAFVGTEAGASYELSGFDDLYASVTVTQTGGVAGYTVAPRAESSTPVVVYP